MSEGGAGAGAGAGAGPWYVYECIPLLKNLAGFEEGSKKNSILTQFIRHMNQNAVSLCLRLVQTWSRDPMRPPDWLVCRWARCAASSPGTRRSAGPRPARSAATWCR